MSIRSRSDRRGFLLFEIMISIIVILAIVIFVVSSYSASTRSIRRSAELLKISNLTVNRMWDFESTGEVKEGAWEGEDGPYRWTAASVPVNNTGINKLMISFSDRTRPSDYRYSVSTYLKAKI